MTGRRPGTGLPPDKDAPLDPQQKIDALEQELQRERARLTVALRRAEALESSCRRAYAMAIDGRRLRPEPPAD